MNDNDSTVTVRFVDGRWQVVDPEQWAEARVGRGEVHEVKLDVPSVIWPDVREWCDQRIAEAVAAERLRIVHLLDAEADKWSRISHDDPRPGHDPIATAKHDTYREAASLVNVRYECKGRPE